MRKWSFYLRFYLYIHDFFFVGDMKITELGCSYLNRSSFVLKKWINMHSNTAQHTSSSSQHVPIWPSSFSSSLFPLPLLPSVSCSPTTSLPSSVAGPKQRLSGRVSVSGTPASAPQVLGGWGRRCWLWCSRAQSPDVTGEARPLNALHSIGKWKLNYGAFTSFFSLSHFIFLSSPSSFSWS